MDDKRFKAIEDKCYDLLESTVSELTKRIKSGDCAAADFQASLATLKYLGIDLKSATMKGPDPDMPDEDDLPFSEGDFVSMS